MLNANRRKSRFVNSLLGVATITYEKPNSPSFRKSGAAEPATIQELSVMLANCGREADAEWVSRRIVVGDGGIGGVTPPSAHTRPIDSRKFHALPWRDALTEIAARERLIIIMEAHNEPKHRHRVKADIHQVQRLLHMLDVRPCDRQMLRTCESPAQAMKIFSWPMSMAA